MTTDTTMNLDKSAVLNKPVDIWEEQAFASIDGPMLDWKQHFPISMLRLGRILTAKESERRNFSAAKVSNLMVKHRDILRTYSPMEIREKLWLYGDIITGGGVKVEWYELNDPHRRNDPPHFAISFYRLYRPPVVVLNNETEPDNTLHHEPART